MATITVDRPNQVANPPVAQSDNTQTAAERQRELLDGFHRKHLNVRNLDWPVLLWMVGIHVGAVAALFFFTWQAVVAAVVMHWLTCSIGICLGYHRYLSHRSFKLIAPAEYFVTLCGVLSGEGSPLNWAANHRVHHQRSDQEGDPHSPTDGNWWSHMMWVFVKRSPAVRACLYERYVPDLAYKPMMQFYERTYGYWVVGAAAAVFGVGTAIGGLYFGLSLFLWAVCFRMAIAYHSTWFVNSATHIWGYRNYETKDLSRNLWWVAVLSYGEGWHNNHHAHPRVAQAGHRWWELDMTNWVIRALKFTGIAREVNDTLPQGKAAAANENDF